jgi:hypothetical protein
MDEQATRRELQDFKEVSIWRELNRLKEIIEGPPHPGLETRVDRFLTRFETIEAERDKQHKANRWRLNVIISLLVLGVAILALKYH